MPIKKSLAEVKQTAEQIAHSSLSVDNPAGCTTSYWHTYTEMYKYTTKTFCLEIALWVWITRQMSLASSLCLIWKNIHQRKTGVDCNRLLRSSLSLLVPLSSEDHIYLARHCIIRTNITERNRKRQLYSNPKIISWGKTKGTWIEAQLWVF